MKRKIIGSFIIIGLAAVATIAFKFYQIYKGDAVSKNSVVFIPTNATYQQVKALVSDCNCIENMEAFNIVAELKKYPGLVKPGRYELKAGESIEEVINKLRIGEQSPVTLTFNNLRTIAQLAGRSASYLECDSLQMLEYLSKPSVWKKYGFTKEQFPAMFIPNSYKLNWNTAPEDFVIRMAKEFKTFWNEERKTKARKLGLSQSEVTTLASIVEEETKKNDEKPTVAGVYLNRIRKGMRLEADPTLIFALGDFTVKRVLDADKKIDTPYNTYMYKGLPPGPIRLPEITSIDAVLNAPRHKYLFFCAKEDFSGYHNFAVTYSQHKKNARRYHAALNKRKIYR